MLIGGIITCVCVNRKDMRIKNWLVYYYWWLESFFECDSRAILYLSSRRV